MEEAKGERRKQEEALAKAERQLEESNAEVKQVSTECDMIAEQGQDPELLELEQQVTGLAKDLGSAEAMPEEVLLSILGKQLGQVKASVERDENEMASMEQKQQELEKAMQEATEAARRLEAEVQLEQRRKETEQELQGQSPEEQQLILQAHQQKLSSRASALETQTATLQTEAEERKVNNLNVIQESKVLQAEGEDVNLQMQIVQEERDAMREAMEHLWQEKSLVDDELRDREEGYIHLTERLTATQDEYCELEALVEQKQEEVAGLQKNGFGITGSWSNTGPLMN